MSAVEAIIKLTPISEELMKALPILFYIAVFEPKREYILYCAVAVALGFAMEENVNSLVHAYTTDWLLFAVVRGFSAGVMHTACGAALGYGLMATYRQRYITVPVAFGLLCVTSTCHSIYNLFVSAGGYWESVGYALPFGVAAAVLVPIRDKLSSRED